MRGLNFSSKYVCSFLQKGFFGTRPLLKTFWKRFKIRSGLFCDSKKDQLTTVSLNPHRGRYSASRKLSQDFTFSTFCDVTASFQNEKIKNKKKPQNSALNTSQFEFEFFFLIDQKLNKKSHEHQDSQPLPRSSKLSSGAVCFHCSSLRCCYSLNGVHLR